MPYKEPTNRAEPHEVQGIRITMTIAFIAMGSLADGVADDVEVWVGPTLVLDADGKLQGYHFGVHGTQPGSLIVSLSNAKNGTTQRSVPHC